MRHYPRNLKINIYLSNKRKPTPYSHSDINLWPGSGPFCWQDTCSGCNSETDLVDALEYFSFNFVPTPNKSLRFTRFRKKDVNLFAIVLTSHWESYTAFMLSVRCLKWPRSFSLQLFVPNNSLFEGTCYSNVIDSKESKQTKRGELVIHKTSKPTLGVKRSISRTNNVFS